MKNILLISILSIFFLGSCLNDLKKSENLAEGVYSVEIKDIEQSQQYTYFKGIVSGAELWFAVGKMDLQVGDIYYYKDPLEMQNFKSKELDKTFEVIFFVNKLQDNPEFTVNNASAHKNLETQKAESIKIEATEGVLSIGQLFANKEKYSGKTVTVKGKVMKFNPEIMKRNWAHIQDGTESNGSYDLTVTGNFITKLGEVVTLEGVVSLDKDFGSGYQYDVIIEGATLK